MPPHSITTAAARTARAPTDAVSLLFVSPDQVQRVALHEGESIVVGRLPPADLVLSHLSVSRRHARFTLEQGALEVSDAGSKNGVLVNGAVITSARVGAGDQIRLGEVDVWVGRAGPLREPHPRQLGSTQFTQRVAEELERTRYSGRPLHLLALLRTPSSGQEDGTWLSGVAAGLRGIDRVTEHAPHLLLCLLVERDTPAALSFAETLRSLAGAPTRAALASTPPGPTNAEALIAAAIERVHEAEPNERVQVIERGLAPGSAETPVIVSPITQRLFELATRTGHADLPLLISGETGAGKEVIARAFHDRGRRAQKTFCEVNCAAIAPTLLESVLFGHEKGAFTGADKRSLGLFEQAEGGTLFLDEVGELPAAAQSALLRALESKRIRRVGGTQEIQVDVRIIAATHRDLRDMITRREFREDLLYRLEGLTVRVPPLRERREEIDPLADQFLSVAAQRWHSSARGISETARNVLRRYAWPGNVRQLRNAIERAAAVCTSPQIELDDLPEYLFEAGGETPSLLPAQLSAGTHASFLDEVREFEITRIRAALEQAGGNRSQAARLLGLPRRTLGGKIKDLGIE